MEAHRHDVQARTQACMHLFKVPVLIFNCLTTADIVYYTETNLHVIGEQGKKRTHSTPAAGPKCKCKEEAKQNQCHYTQDKRQIPEYLMHQPHMDSEPIFDFQTCKESRSSSRMHTGASLDFTTACYGHGCDSHCCVLAMTVTKWQWGYLGVEGGGAGGLPNYGIQCMSTILVDPRGRGGMNAPISAVEMGSAVEIHSRDGNSGALVQWYPPSVFREIHPDSYGLVSVCEGHAQDVS